MMFCNSKQPSHIVFTNLLFSDWSNDSKGTIFHFYNNKHAIPSLWFCIEQPWSSSFGVPSLCLWLLLLLLPAQCQYSKLLALGHSCMLALESALCVHWHTEHGLALEKPQDPCICSETLLFSKCSEMEERAVCQRSCLCAHWVVGWPRREEECPVQASHRQHIGR